MQASRLASASLGLTSPSLGQPRAHLGLFSRGARRQLVHLRRQRPRRRRPSQGKARGSREAAERQPRHRRPPPGEGTPRGRGCQRGGGATPLCSCRLPLSRPLPPSRRLHLEGGGPRLFDGLHFHLHGPFNKPSRKDLLSLLREGGGTAAADKWPDSRGAPGSSAEHQHTRSVAARLCKAPRRPAVPLSPAARVTRCRGGPARAVRRPSRRRARAAAEPLRREWPRPARPRQLGLRVHLAARVPPAARRGRGAVPRVRGVLRRS